jgi:dGTPase
MHKTQVLVSHTSDHHRTRLTHTLEVAQISRTIARQLGLHEDLTEAIALVHDLGHPPFGHAGEEALQACLAEHGGFEHNRQGLRLVEELEQRYPAFPGLNLTWEVRESLAFHSKRPEAVEVQPYRLTPQTFLEAQVVDAADSLAYNTHDVDDALSLGLLQLEDLHGLEIWRRAQERVEKEFGPLTADQLQPAMVRALVDWQVNDLLHTTRQRLAALRIDSVAAARNCPEPVVAISPELGVLKGELEAFLFRKVYLHYRVSRMSAKAQRIIQALFAEYRRHAALLPPPYARRAEATGLEAALGDYLAGLTDHSAQEEYLRLFHPFNSV